MVLLPLTINVIYNLLCFVLGVAQGVITGIRGLCNGLGPALYGFIFYLCNVKLEDQEFPPTPATNVTSSSTIHKVFEVRMK